MTPNEIILKIRRGGQAELGILYEECREEFLKWIMKEYHFSLDDSKDIYQLTILIFYDNVKLRKLEYLTSSIKTYLFGIGKNLAMDYMRKSKKVSSISQDQWLNEYVMEEQDNNVNEQTLSRAKRALAKLGEPCQQLIRMFYYGKKSMEEITQALGYKNPETAKNQKCKCMKKLRKLYEEEVDEGINQHSDRGKYRENVIANLEVEQFKIEKLKGL